MLDSFIANLNKSLIVIYTSPKGDLPDPIRYPPEWDPRNSRLIAPKSNLGCRSLAPTAKESHALGSHVTLGQLPTTRSFDFKKRLLARHPRCGHRIPSHTSASPRSRPWASKRSAEMFPCQHIALLSFESVKDDWKISVFTLTWVNNRMIFWCKGTHSFLMCYSEWSHFQN